MSDEAGTANARRGRGPNRSAAELRRDLARMKAKYDELAQEVRDAIDAIEQDEPPKLVARRLRQRVRFGGRAWSKEEMIAAAWEWRHRYGETPTAPSWNPAMVRAKGGDPVLLERYVDGEWPATATVMRHFGSWNAMVDEAGLPRNDHQKGNRTRTAGDQDGLPEWTGWELIRPYRERARIMSQAELAKRAGLAWATVRNIEQGLATNPSLRVFLAVAAALGVPPTALLETRVAAGDPDQPRPVPAE